MKKLALALVALAVSAPALAAPADERPMIGLGISIDPDAQRSPTIELYAPLRVNPQFRLEPSLGILTGDDRSDITLGIGAFLVNPLAQQVDWYAGGRLKLNFADDDQNDESGTDFSLAGALGGEYYLVPRFSLGLEGQLGFYSASEASGDQDGIFTTGLAFLRMYF
jgi:hypothetical protein